MNKTKMPTTEIAQKNAHRRVEQFKRDYPAALWPFAGHAALPVVLNAELLHLIRINFFQDTPEPLPYTAEADLLLSPLCQEIGVDLYEIESEARNILLQEFVNDPRYGQERLRQIAGLLWKYIEHRAPWEDHLRLQRAQQLTALNFLNTAKAKEWLSTAKETVEVEGSELRDWFVAINKELQRPLKRTLREIKKKALEQILADLFEKYRAYDDQLLNALSTADKFTIKNHIVQLEQEIQEVEAELSLLESVSQNIEKNPQILYDHLSKIDFNEVITQFRQVLAQFDRGSGAALFLLQNSIALCGDLCVTRIRNILQQETAHFRSVALSFAGKDMFVGKDVKDEAEMLFARIGEHWNLSRQSESWEQYVERILQAFYNSVQSGDVIFFEFKSWDSLSAQEQVLRCFLDYFWIPLVKNLPSIAQKYGRVKFLGIITSEGPLSSQISTSPFLGNIGEFHPEKIHELPLRHWTNEEILDWLTKFTRLDNEQINKLANSIYVRSMSGIPALVRNELLRWFEEQGERDNSSNL